MLESVSLKEMNKVIIEDMSNFKPGKHVTGGGYSFKEVYIRNSEDTFEVEYFTSSDFPYCNVYGTFRECRNCSEFNQEEGFCDARLLTVTQQQLEEDITTLEYEEGVFVKMKGRNE